MVRYLTTRYTISERRACRAAKWWRSSHRYCGYRDPLTALRVRMREIAQARVRFGYRRVLVMLQREGWEVGKSRLYRVYHEEGLALRRRRPWRHVSAVHRLVRTPAQRRNEVWSMDFVLDQLADGRRFRSLTMIDLFTRECLAMEVGYSLKAENVVQVLERLKYERGVPQRIYCDNGSEFVSGLTDHWAYTNGVSLDFSRRGKPVDNAVIESFNGRFCEECLNTHWSNPLATRSRRSMLGSGTTTRPVLTELSRVFHPGNS